MKVKLIYNPVAGNGTFINQLDYIIKKFQQKGMQIDPYRTSKRKALETMFSKMNANEYKKILVAGGDGTINQVVNGLLKHDVNLPLGIIPIGTANDFAQYFNLPSEIEEITGILLSDNYTLSDVGCVNDKYFINVASLGALIDVSQKTNVEFKNSLGILAYYLNGISELPNLKPITIKVNCKDMNYEGEIFLMLVMNGKSAGGFNRIASSASINDGLLDIFIFKKCPVHELVVLLLEVINGKHMNDSNVIHFKTKELSVDCANKVGTDIDGEEGSGFPLNIKVIPRKLRIITRFNNEEGYSQVKSFDMLNIKKFIDHISKGLFNEHPKNNEMKNNRNLMDDINEMIKDLQRHNAFDYINKRSLNEDYFKNAEETLNNGYLYIVLSSTGSAAGETIAKVTNKHYSHASLSFDEELKTIVSYNGGGKVYSPGLNLESLELFYQKSDANVMIYKIKASYHQKKKILDSIRNINQEGSSYNVLGLIFPYSHKDNIMFCSQFVYSMLKQSGLAYFDKKPEAVKPTDLVELDYERKLEFCRKTHIKDVLRDE